MCGITGFLSKNYNSEHLQKITDSLYHRGPDADGIFFDENIGIGLGHRRLSILDLSTNANQPFYSVCDRYVLVFNGEIYNFEAIYNELKKETGFERKTVSDTEIILEAFVHWGDDFIHKLNGMFAFAIWDKNNNELKLFRDRIGIKPLYYYWVDNVFAFSSEIKGLTQLITKSKLTINRNSIYDILHLGYTPQKITAFNEIKKVPSGSFLKGGFIGMKGSLLYRIHQNSMSRKVNPKLISDNLLYLNLVINNNLVPKEIKNSFLTTNHYIISGLCYVNKFYFKAIYHSLVSLYLTSIKFTKQILKLHVL